MPSAVRAETVASATLAGPERMMAWDIAMTQNERDDNQWRKMDGRAFVSLDCERRFMAGNMTWREMAGKQIGGVEVCFMDPGRVCCSQSHVFFSFLRY